MTAPGKLAVSFSVAKISERFQQDAVAALVQIRDEQASDNARAQAASKLLEYGIGRPPQAKPITVADLSSMTEQQRVELLSALLQHFETEMPGSFKALMVEAYKEAIATPPRPRFRRGTPPALPAPASARAEAPPGAHGAQNAPLAVMPAAVPSAPHGAPAAAAPAGQADEAPEAPPAQPADRPIPINPLLGDGLVERDDPPDGRRITQEILLRSTLRNPTRTPWPALNRPAYDRR
jgi:hypothetical protein